MYIVQYVYRLKREEHKFTADIQYGVIGFFLSMRDIILTKIKIEAKV